MKSKYYKIFALAIVTIIAFYSIFYIVIQNTTKPLLITPTGKYNIGVKKIHLINPNVCPSGFYLKGKSEKDFSANNKNHCQEIFLSIFYPTKDSGGISAPYPKSGLENVTRYLQGNNHFTKKEINQLTDISRISTNIFVNSKIASNKKFPVIFFIPGSGMQVGLYTNIIRELVSHGYIVIGLDSLIISGALKLSNNHISKRPAIFDGNFEFDSPELKQNILYVLSNFSTLGIDKNIRQAMNTKSIGVLGHSMGAMTLAYILNNNQQPIKISAIALMDPGTSLGKQNYPIHDFKIPTIVLWSAYFKYKMQGTIKKTHTSTEKVITPTQNNITYSNHLNFTDYSTLQYQAVFHEKNIKTVIYNPQNMWLGSGNGINISEEVNHTLLDFFNANLQDGSESK